MYYPQQSPAIQHKLPNHHEQNPWTRPHHPVLSAPGTQPNVVGNIGPPPTSPGYAIYTNGAVNPMQHHPNHMPHPMAHASIQHHHSNSLTHYPSAPNGHNNHQPIVMNQGSPASAPGQVISQHWQQQLLKCEMSRSSRSPHHRSKASAIASRTVAKSAIPITNPNTIKAPESTESPKAGDAASPSLGESSPTSVAVEANHPSSTVAPIADTGLPVATRPISNSWSSLDMGGINIKQIPPNSGLFTFTFLTTLYLNHNSLTVIPPEISKLRQLELLDLSGNNLSYLPPEIGLLSQLKELYVFDNHIAVIPPEFGTLHQLKTLGVEGNPLDAQSKQMIQTNGTPYFISYIRDNCPSLPKPPPRLWKDFLSPAEREAMLADPGAETFSVLCYNILCERAATERLYGYTPSWALAWDYRKTLILQEIQERDADFVCLQEMDIAQYEDYFTKNLENEYEGVYWPKSRYKTFSENDRRMVDGCATFFRSSKYQLVERHLVEFSTVAMQRQDFKKTDDMFNRVLGKDHIGTICLFENKHTGSRLILANTHIHWDPHFRDVKLVQIALMAEEIEKVAADFAKYPPRPPPTPGVNGSFTTDENLPKPPTYSDSSKIPVVMCSDLNSVPESGVYEFLSTGKLSPDHEDWMSHTYGKYTSEGLKHQLGLKSAYAPTGADMPVTNYTAAFQGILDYVWYSSATLAVNRILGEIDKKYLEKVVGFPNTHFPSDHISLAVEFRLKPSRDNQPRTPQP